MRLQGYAAAVVLTVLAAPAGATTTYVYRGQPLTCQYAYTIWGEGGVLDSCPAGDTLRAAQGRIVIDETKLPEGGLAGLNLLL